MKNYHYPIDADWSKEDIIVVINLFNAIESAYEEGIEINKLKRAYDQFKEVVPSKSQEKQLGKQFENLSGYSIYRTIQELRTRSKESHPTKKSQLIRMSTEKRRI